MIDEIIYDSSCLGACRVLTTWLTDEGMPSGDKTWRRTGFAGIFPLAVAAPLAACALDHETTDSSSCKMCSLFLCSLAIDLASNIAQDLVRIYIIYRCSIWQLKIRRLGTLPSFTFALKY